MKGNKKLLIIAVLLLLITVSYTTYAIYRESTTATGTIQAAAWSVKVKKANDTNDAVAFETANVDIIDALRLMKNFPIHNLFLSEIKQAVSVKIT